MDKLRPPIFRSKKFEVKNCIHCAGDSKDTVTMASVYKSLSKTNGSKEEGATSKKNKQRVLILSSRGITYRFVPLVKKTPSKCRLEMEWLIVIITSWNRHRHLLNDIASLLPHSRKDAKLDTKSKLYQLNELAELYNCNNVFFFEARKGKDLYLWMSKAPNGPTVKMHMQNCMFNCPSPKTQSPFPSFTTQPPTPPKLTNMTP